eukprot:TRINITY_DN4264_c0_g2_i1.p1 TRINITY_DN4264_c0_g2~~TRINITY_DN4264_c0_g2_i1.p1  ORF type:complete len:890 (-),score=423.85 TRINITY_DN4264_c0_g2_i1:69-2738(-)
MAVLIRTALLLGLVLAAVSIANAVVIGIDLGSEFVKVAMVKPGSGFDIVVDEQTRRKFPVLLTFDENGERLFGNGASSLATRRPTQSFSYLQWLLGKGFNSPAIQRAKDFFLPNDFVEVEGRGTIGIRRNATHTFTVEEVMSMILKHAKTISETAAGIEVKDCVITVPPFFTNKERQALLDAADLAGLNVLGLINENTAAALQYSINYDFDANKTANVVFYNMGASSTKVSLVKYSAYLSKVGKTNKTVGQFEVKAEAHDETLGGTAFDLRLAHKFGNEFMAKLKKQGDSTDIFTLPRVTARLKQTANRIKEVLSANKETPVYIESLYNDIDFVTMANQDDLHNIAVDLFDRVVKPLEKLLKDSGISPKNIDNFVLVGGGTRIPRVQALLKEFLARDALDQNLNGDEAPALGASFRAANLSALFRVRHIGMTDITSFPVGVRFSDLTPATEQASEDGAKGFTKRVSVFSRFNSLGKRKSVSFSHDNDLNCSMFYDSADLLPIGTTAPIASYEVTGIKAIVNKHPTLGKPKINLSFQFDESSVVSMVAAEATLEETIKVPIKNNSTESKKEEKKEEKEGATEESKKEEKKEEEKPAESAEKPEEEAFTYKKNTLRFVLDITAGAADLKSYSSADRTRSMEVLRKLSAFDQARRELAEAKNSVESFIYSTREKLYDEDINTVTTEEQRQSVESMLSTASTWLEENEFSTNPTVFRTKLAEMKVLWDPIALRAREHRARPVAFSETRTILSTARTLAATLRKDKPWIPEADFKRFEGLIATAEKWLDDKEAAQKAAPLHEAPLFSSVDIINQAKPVSDYGTILLKRQKPKEKPAPKTSSSNNSTSTNNTTSSEQKTEGDAKSEEPQSEAKPESKAESNQEAGSQSEEKKDEL